MPEPVRIQTVTGDVSSADLGVTLMHEHVFILVPEVEQNYPEGWDEQERIADAVRQFRRLKQRGVDSLVDLTVLGLGRYLPRIQAVAEQVELNIVVATGLYTFNDLPLQFTFQDPKTFYEGREVLVEMFTRDIERGIADTGVHAAILKCATDEPGLTPGVERVLRAVARTHLATGIPISTHTHAASQCGLVQQQVFAEEGVDLTRVVIGHCGDTDDLVYLRRLMEAGSTIGMDRFGIDVILPFEQRVATVAALCAEGYASRMVLSHDTCAHFRWLEPEKLRALSPNWHFFHIVDDVLPALRARGVTQSQIDEMLVDNPRRLFETSALPTRRPQGAA